MARLVFTQQLSRCTEVPVWISENAGDDWQRVATYLPPVYAVRFY